tara:strand:- start:749 stop:1156 length:408 start_codon:yes stop_codon:yes gene_type:complete
MVNEMIHFLSAMLFGSMVSFMILVSPVVFSVLSSYDAKNFLRKFFPRLFTFGLAISGLLILFSFKEVNILSQFLSVIIFLGFLLNLLIITPRINKYRDLELKNIKSAKKIFNALHFLSVCIFIIQLLLCLVLFLY